MGGVAGEPPLALVVPGTICGEAAALAVVIAGSDFRPSEYPTAKNSAQTPTSPKNRTSNLPVPSVISVSCEEAMVQLQELLPRELLLLTQSSALPPRPRLPTTSADPRKSPPAPEKSQSYFFPHQSPSESANSAAAR